MRRPGASLSSHARAERHRSPRTGWLRAAVLGANDGILSTAALLVGVIQSGGDRAVTLTVGAAGMVAGAAAMAAGEFVSVSSQRDAERADLALEAAELAADPESERAELAEIYRARGLSPALAAAVAEELSARPDLLDTHAREELGLVPGRRPRPVQAAGASALAFGAGALVPVLAALAAAGTALGTAAVVVVALVALAVLGALGAAAGGAGWSRAAARVVAGGCLAMALTGIAGRAAGVALG